MATRFMRLVGSLTAAVGVVFTATAMAGPGPIGRPPLQPRPGPTPTPIRVVVPTAATLPGARYVWVQPVLLRLAGGRIAVPRLTP